MLKGFNHYRAARTRPFMSYQPLVLSRISGTGQRQNPLTFSTWLHPKETTLPALIIVPNLRATTTEFMSAWVSLLILSLNQFSYSKSDRTFFQNCYRCGLLCCFIERVFWHFLSGFSWEWLLVNLYRTQFYFCSSILILCFAGQVLFSLFLFLWGCLVSNCGPSMNIY